MSFNLNHTIHALPTEQTSTQHHRIGRVTQATLAAEASAIKIAEFRFPNLLTAAMALFLAFLPLMADGQESNNKKGSGRQARPTTFWPKDVDYDKSITTPKQFFGFDIGQRHLRHDQIVSYLQKISKQTNRIQLSQYASTHGRRPLLLLTITSPKNHERIDEIQKLHRRLSKPEVSDSVDLRDMPAVINMGYGVHGDEPSATNTSPLVAYYLAAAQGEQIESWLSDCVILLDPSLNPDGFDRFAHWENTYRGRIANPDPATAEHNQTWPPGRVNYYWFDLNRDWLPLVHPESRGRMKWFHKWKPNVVLDFHEMGTNSTFFFQPGIPQRTNPLTPRQNIELTGEIAKFHVKEFDKRGTLYLTQELFDDFYMGKGSTYPDLHGSIGILFEQASSRGQVQESSNGLVRFPDTIRNQFTTSLTSLEATTKLRTKLLNYQRDFYKKSADMSRQSPFKFMAFRAIADRSRLQAFADTLLRHDIQCYWLKENLKHGKTTLTKNNTLIVPVQQAEYRFIRSLFDRPTNFQENIFYDVSAWTLDLAYNLEKFTLPHVNEETLRLARIGEKSPRKFAPKKTDYAYAIDWRNADTPKLLNKLLQKDVLVKVAKAPFTVKQGNRNRNFGYGTLVVPLGIQKGKFNLIATALKNAAQNGMSITTIQSGLTPKGIDLGSNQMATINKPSVAILIGRQASAYEAGATWHSLDHLLQMPTTLLEVDRMSRARLSRYSTIVLTSGNYSTVAENLEQWVRDGGTLVAVGRAAGSVRSWGSQTPENQDAAQATPKEDNPIQLPFADARKTRALQLISGSIFNTSVDRTHPLCYGITTKTLPVFRNHTQFIAPSTSPYQNPLVYTDENVLMSGYASQENVDKFSGKASATVKPMGSGRVIMLSDDPNFRGFWHGTRRVFYNSIFFGNMTGGSRR